jgi:hypothetical protein
MVLASEDPPTTITTARALAISVGFVFIPGSSLAIFSKTARHINLAFALLHAPARTLEFLQVMANYERSAVGVNDTKYSNL